MGPRGWGSWSQPQPTGISTNQYNPYRDFLTKYILFSKKMPKIVWGSAPKDWPIDRQEFDSGYCALRLVTHKLFPINELRKEIERTNLEDIKLWRPISEYKNPFDNYTIRWWPFNGGGIKPVVYVAEISDHISDVYSYDPLLVSSIFNPVEIIGRGRT